MFEEKQISLKSTLSSIKEIKNIEIVKNVSNKSIIENNVYRGNFTYEDTKYIFAEKISEKIGFHRIECIFDIEDPFFSTIKEKDKYEFITKSTNNFNSYRAGVKAVILFDHDYNKNDNVYRIRFISELISQDQKIKKDTIISILNILKGCPETFSVTLKKVNIKGI